MSYRDAIIAQMEDDPECSPTDQRRAALAVCAHARDADDARLLLEMLGLIPAREVVSDGSVLPGPE